MGLVLLASTYRPESRHEDMTQTFLVDPSRIEVARKVPCCPEGVILEIDMHCGRTISVVLRDMEEAEAKFAEFRA